MLENKAVAVNEKKKLSLIFPDQNSAGKHTSLFLG